MCVCCLLCVFFFSFFLFLRLMLLFSSAKTGPRKEKSPSNNSAARAHTLRRELKGEVFIMNYHSIQAVSDVVAKYMAPEGGSRFLANSSKR